MRVLSVAPYLPYEGIPHAGGEYLLRHLTALGAHADVTLLVPGVDDVLAARDLAPEGLEVVVGHVEGDERTRSRWLADAAYRRLTGAPPMPAAEVLRAVRAGGLVELARRSDVVELHWPEYARFASELRRAGVRTPVAVVEHDVDVRALADKLRRALAGYRRALALASSPVLRRLERDGLRDADLVLVFKEADRALLHEVRVQTPVLVLDPWVEVPPEHGRPEREPGTVLFTGAMWRPENDEGARWLVRRVWPAVRARVPHARLVVAGAGPTEALRADAEDVGGVHVLGEVPSLLPCYLRASVFAAPLFTGGGIKFKVPQAMLCGLPVVATTAALVGVLDRAPDGVLWGVADEPSQMADSLVEALQEPERAADVGRAAAAWAARTWSFSASMERVTAAYRALVDRRSG